MSVQSLTLHLFFSVTLCQFEKKISIFGPKLNPCTNFDLQQKSKGGVVCVASSLFGMLLEMPSKWDETSKCNRVSTGLRMLSKSLYKPALKSPLINTHPTHYHRLPLKLICAGGLIFKEKSSFSKKKEYWENIFLNYVILDSIICFTLIGYLLQKFQKIMKRM